MTWSAGASGERDILTYAAKAGAAISPYRILMAGTDADEVIAATSGVYVPLGVSGNGSENNKGTYAEHDAVNVKYAGMVKVSMSGTGSRGDRVMATTAGQGTRHPMTTEGVWVLGIAMESWVANQVITVLIDRQLVVDTESIDTDL